MSNHEPGDPAEIGGSMKRPGKAASLLTAVAAGALLLAVPALAGTSVAAKVHPAKTSIVKGGILKFAEAPSSAPNYIFPVNPSPDQSVYNLDDFQPLMYEALWNASPTEPTIDFADSIGNKPVWFDRDTAVTVTLKHYMWSNGTPVTTRDITFEINLARAAGPNWGDYTPGNFPYNVKRITVQSAYKMTFYLDKAYNPTYYLDGQLGVIIPLPQNVWDRESLTGKVGNWDLNPAGAKKVWNFLNSYAEKTSTYTSSNPIWGVIDGPYELKSFGGSSAADVFVPNPKYSGPRSHVAEVEELPFTSDTAEYNELRSGNDSINVGYIPDQDVPTIPEVKASGYNVPQVRTWGIDYIIPNLKNPVLGPAFSQLYMRQAFQHLVDQTTMIKDFLHGYGIPTYGPTPIYPKGNAFADSYETRNPYPYNVSAAKSLLAAHGWRMVGGVQTCESSKCGAGVKIGTKLDIQLLYSSGSTALTQQDLLLQSDMAKAGIKLILKTESFNTVIGIVSTCNPAHPTSPTCTWQFGEYGGISYGIYPSGGELFEPGGALNAGSYNNSEVTSLIHQIRHASTLAPYYKYENLLAKTLPWIWQPTASTIGAVSKNLGGAVNVANEFDDFYPQYVYFTR
jgi:peptide/nickel transport system substrate-binding protein